MFRRKPSPGGCGCRAAGVVVCFGWGDFFRVVFFSDLFFLRTHMVFCTYEAPIASFTFIFVPGYVQGDIIYLACLSVCVCVTFAVFTDG